MNDVNKENNLSKDELLKELSNLGINTKSGRKTRSDKGQIRGPNNKVRSDKGLTRMSTNGRQKEPLAIYLSFKSKLLNMLSNSAEPKYVIKTDENGIYIPATKENSKIYMNYTVTYQHNLIARTVKHIAGKTIDLEKYRFEALQSIASNEPIDDELMPHFWKEINDTFATTTLDLFVRLYHIKEEEYIRWSYERWREDYSLVSDLLQYGKVTLEYDHRPGSPEFLPDLSYRLSELENDRRQSFILSKEYVNAAAHIRDEEYAKLAKPITKTLLNDPQYAHLSLYEIDKEVKRRVDKDVLRKNIDARLTEYVDNKMKGE